MRRTENPGATPAAFYLCGRTQATSHIQPANISKSHFKPVFTALQFFLSTTANSSRGQRAEKRDFLQRKLENQLPDTNTSSSVGPDEIHSTLILRQAHAALVETHAVIF